MIIVKFKNGTYGIRKWTLFGYEFKSLDDFGVSNNFWWNIKRHPQYKEECQADLYKVKEIFEKLNDNGREVNFI